ncbi:MAG: hypothetical protein RIT18_990, partial [Actinomycetota bacterium]
MKEPPALTPVVLSVLGGSYLERGLEKLCPWSGAEALATFLAELLAFSKSILRTLNTLYH